MLAPNEAGREPASEPTPTPPEPKRRTVTLTNRAPISIIEDDWPVFAEGACGDGCYEAGYDWKISVRARREKRRKTGCGFWEGGRVLIHAKYEYWNESHEDDAQTVRVGRLLTQYEAASELWKHIVEIGDELRERIIDEHLRKRVINALDACFAKLEPVKDY
jgi:hypothetical protein